MWLLRRAVHSSILFPFIVLSSGISSLMLSGFVPGGLLVSWVLVAGTGMVGGLLGSLGVAVFYGLSNKNTSHKQNRSATLFSGILATIAIAFLALVGFTGPDIAAMTSVVALFVIFVLFNMIDGGQKGGEKGDTPQS